MRRGNGPPVDIELASARPVGKASLEASWLGILPRSTAAARIRRVYGIIRLEYGQRVHFAFDLLIADPNCSLTCLAVVS
jgi:hypothetical protein